MVLKIIYNHDTKLQPCEAFKLRKVVVFKKGEKIVEWGENTEGGILLMKKHYLCGDISTYSSFQQIRYQNEKTNFHFWTHRYSIASRE